MATHSSIFAWRIPWTEEPGRLQSMDTTKVTQHTACAEDTKFVNTGSFFPHGMVLSSRVPFFNHLLAVFPLLNHLQRDVHQLIQDKKKMYKVYKKTNIFSIGKKVTCPILSYPLPSDFKMKFLQRKVKRRLLPLLHCIKKANYSMKKNLLKFLGNSKIESTFSSIYPNSSVSPTLLKT